MFVPSPWNYPRSVASSSAERPRRAAIASFSAALAAAAASASACAAANAAASASRCAISSAVKGRCVTSPVEQSTMVCMSVSDIVSPYASPYSVKVEPKTKLPDSAVAVKDVMAFVFAQS